MCNAMQRNENHFGRVTFPPCVRELPPPPPPQHHHTAPHHTRCTAAPLNPPRHKPGPLHRTTMTRSASPPRRPHPPRRRYETRPAAAVAVGGLGDASVTPVGRRPKTRLVTAGGRGALGIRRLDVIDPNRPRGAPLAALPTADSGVRACVHVWQPLTARPHTAVAKQRFSLPSSAPDGSASAAFFTTTGLHRPCTAPPPYRGGILSAAFRSRCWQMARRVRARVPCARPPTAAANRIPVVPKRL